MLASETTGATPCTNTASVTVTVNPTPSTQTIAPTQVTTCANTILTLVSTGGTLENLTILNQDFYQMSNQYEENALKKELLFEHIFNNEDAILSLKKMFENYKYPDLEECVTLYKYYKMEL